MYYIDTKKLLRKRDILFLRLLPTGVVFAAFLVVILLSWNAAKQNVVEQKTIALRRHNDSVAERIIVRMNTYQDILYGAIGLFEASAAVERSEWSAYFRNFDLVQRYPGVAGAGYAEVFSARDAEVVTAKIKADMPEFIVHPAPQPGSDISVAAIKFIEPLTERNRSAIGFDLYSEPVRRSALEIARDSGQPAVTDVVPLIGSSTTPIPGIIMYMPHYRTDAPRSTLEERRAGLIGYAYAPFRTADLIDAIVTERDENYAFRIQNVGDEQVQTVYQSDNFEAIAGSDHQQMTTDIQLASTTWQVVGIVRPTIVDSATRSRPASALWGGLVVNFSIAGFIYLLLLNRSKVLADREERGIQSAKDELLALASHQLRTPATGVKQYIGMLKEGFVGELTAEQKAIVERAYDSNERQLGTINEMLVVARADAGNLKMQLQDCDYAALLRDIIDEQRGVLLQRRQRVITKIPQRPIMVKADRQFLRMALENILSNASKYTPEQGTITIRLIEKDTSVVCSIQDTGVGVEEKDTPLLFKKFSRIPNEFTGRVSGTGIGLYLAQKIIKSHNGTVRFESQVGKGSIVSVTLPR